MAVVGIVVPTNLRLVGTALVLTIVPSPVVGLVVLETFLVQ